MMPPVYSDSTPAQPEQIASTALFDSAIYACIFNLGLLFSSNTSISLPSLSLINSIGFMTQSFTQLYQKKTKKWTSNRIYFGYYKTLIIPKIKS